MWTQKLNLFTKSLIFQEHKQFCKEVSAVPLIPIEKSREVTLHASNGESNVLPQVLVSLIQPLGVSLFSEGEMEAKFWKKRACVPNYKFYIKSLISLQYEAWLCEKRSTRRSLYLVHSELCAQASLCFLRE